MRRFLLILPVCCWLTLASGVNLDSLWGVWNDKSQPDTNRLEAMHKIAWYGYLYSQPDSAFYFASLEYDFAKSVGNKKWMSAALFNQGATFYFQSNYESALEYYHKSLKIKEETGDKRGMASLYNNIGLIYQEQGNYELAMEYYDKSLKGYEEMGDKRRMANGYNNIGIIYQQQGNYKQALAYYSKSLNIKEETGDKRGMASAYINIGVIYQEQDNYEQALEYNQESLKIFKEIGDKMGMANAYNNIGIIYYKQNNYEKALMYYEKGLKRYEKIGNKEGTATSCRNIGEIYREQGNYEQALKYYDKSLKIAEEIGNKGGMAASYVRIGHIYKEQGNYSEAIDLGKKGLAMAQESGVAIAIKEASELLYGGYKETGQAVKALKMHELYSEMNDSINSKENRQAAIKLQYQHQYEKEQAVADARHQEELALSAEREKRQQLILYATGGGLALVLLFAFLIFNRLRLARRQKKVIEAQKELVEEQKQKVEEQKKDITDSIQYAENIQQALLPTEQSVQDLLSDSFILFQPKDIVSGDFYWMQHHNGLVYLAVCDCTGHGVPGAFMSMIGSSLLDEAVLEKGITQPSEIFHEVRKGFIKALKQTEEAGAQKDGMDATLIVWDKNNTLQAAAALNPVLLIRNGEIRELKPDRQPVGYLTGKQEAFTHHEVQLEKGDSVYLFTDGYHDQFGGPDLRKFMLKNFKELLLSIQDKTMEEQKTILETTMAEWKGDIEQIDDILVMGVRF